MDTITTTRVDIALEIALDAIWNAYSAVSDRTKSSAFAY